MTRRSLHKQAGVALVTAIFLLVVLAGLAVAIVSLSSTQQNNAAKDEMGTQAYLAAKAGLQWALYTALQAPQGGRLAKLNCSTPYTFAMPPGTSLSSFNVTISCSTVAQAPVYGGGGGGDPTADHFRITATACNSGPGVIACPLANPGPDYVQRVVIGQL